MNYIAERDTRLEKCEGCGAQARCWSDGTVVILHAPDAASNGEPFYEPDLAAWHRWTVAPIGAIEGFCHHISCPDCSVTCDNCDYSDTPF